MLKEAGIIKIPQVKKAEPKEGDGKKKGKQAAGKQEEEKKDEPIVPPEALYLESDCLTSIDEVNSFDEGMLNYFDMLECLLRIARDYKFNAEQEAILTSLPMRLEFLIN